MNLMCNNLSYLGFTSSTIIMRYHVRNDNKWRRLWVKIIFIHWKGEDFLLLFLTSSSQAKIWTGKIWREITCFLKILFNVYHMYKGLACNIITGLSSQGNWISIDNLKYNNQLIIKLSYISNLIRFTITASWNLKNM